MSGRAAFPPLGLLTIAAMLPRDWQLKVLAGEFPATADDARPLDPRELGEGWRLPCQARAESDLTLDLAQWEATILADHSTFDFTPCFLQTPGNPADP